MFIERCPNCGEKAPVGFFDVNIVMSSHKNLDGTWRCCSVCGGLDDQHKKVAASGFLGMIGGFLGIVTVPCPERPMYSIKLYSYNIEWNSETTATIILPAAIPGYVAQTPLNVSIHNTGNRPTEIRFTLSGDINSFTLKNNISQIGVNKEDIFTITPITGLNIGSYELVVTVESPNDSLTKNVLVFKFTVHNTHITVGSETELKAAVNNAGNGVPLVIILSQNIELTTTLSILNNKDITLTSDSDTKFFKLSGANGVSTITIQKGGILKLDNIIVTHVTGATGNGVTNNYGTLYMFGGEISDNSNLLQNSKWNLGGGVFNYGTFVMFDGKIYNNKDSNSVYGGVSNSGTFTMFGGEISDNIGAGVSNGGIVTMSGGKISNNNDGAGVSNGGIFTMSGGKISNNTNAFGGGVFNNSGGIFMMSGGEISNNKATHTYIYGYFGGGGVYNRNTFIFSGGTISNNSAICGGGVYNVASYLNGNNDGYFEMSGGKISDNKATDGGGGVYNYGPLAVGSSVYIAGTFAMFGGEISNNKATDGGGICNYGVIELSNGRISSNTAANSGGGVWVDDRDLFTLFIRDGVVFSNNYAPVAYNRDTTHNVIYNSHIGSRVTWTYPFTQGYNNYDISYTYGVSATTFRVTVDDSYAAFTGAGDYSVGAIVTLNAGTRIGYTFSRWVVNEGDITLSSTTSTTATFTMPINNVVVTAIWNPIQYTITYNLNSGTNAMDNPNSYNAANSFPIIIINPTRTNYEFSGWTVTYYNGTETTIQSDYRISAGTTGDVMLVANWRSQFTVQFVNYDGVVLRTETVSYGNTATAPAINPTRSGYIFVGWDVAFNNVVSNLIVTAQYRVNSSSEDHSESSDTTNNSLSNKSSPNTTPSNHVPTEQNHSTPESTNGNETKSSWPLGDAVLIVVVMLVIAGVICVLLRKR
jgi:uncharacterized repeat protein (TIGR02543 family)